MPNKPNKRGSVVDMAPEAMVNLIIASLIIVTLVYVGIYFFAIFHKTSSVDAKYCVNGINDLTQSILLHDMYPEAQDGGTVYRTFHCTLPRGEIIATGNIVDQKGCNGRSLCVTTFSANKVLYKKTIKGIGRIEIVPSLEEPPEGYEYMTYIGSEYEEKTGYSTDIVKIAIRYDRNDPAPERNNPYGVLVITQLPLVEPQPQQSKAPFENVGPNLPSSSSSGSGISGTGASSQISGTWPSGSGGTPTPNLADNEILPNGNID